MNKYLEKIAKEYYTRTDVNDNRAGTVLGGALVGGITTHVINNKIGNDIRNRLDTDLMMRAPTVGQSVLDRIHNDVMPRTNTTMDLLSAGGRREAAYMYGGRAGAEGTHYVPYQQINATQRVGHIYGTARNAYAGVINKVMGEGTASKSYSGEFSGKPTFSKNYIHTGYVPNTDLLAHEMGRAVDLHTGLGGAKRVASMAGKALNGLPAAALGGLALTNENTRDYAWAVPLAVAAPALREEVAAGTNAARLVTQFGGDASKLRSTVSRKFLGKAIPALAASGALAGINYLRHKGEEVNPDEWIKERD